MSETAFLNQSLIHSADSKEDRKDLKMIFWILSSLCWSKSK